MSDLSNKINEIDQKLDAALDRMDGMIAKPIVGNPGEMVVLEEYGTSSAKIPATVLDYFCVTGNNDNKVFSIDKNNASMPDADLWYSKDLKKWSKISWAGTDGTKINLNKGESCWIKGDNATFSTSSSYYFRCNKGNTLPDLSYSGNIMSLVDSTCKSVTIPCDYCFYHFLEWQSNGRFKGLKLPATTLKEHCYEGLFASSSVEEIPELPATTLAPYCYKNFINGSYYTFTELPELPATTLAEGCYQEMFTMHASMTQPIKMMKTLPATTPAKNCYYYMFRTYNNPSGTSSLLDPPEIMLENDNAEGCMRNMFNNCRFGSPLKVHFTSWSSASYASTDWLKGVHGETTIICPSALDTTTRDDSHIPTGWTIYNGSNDTDDDSKASTDASTASTYLVRAGKQVGVISVDTALTLSAESVPSTEIAYAEVVLDIAANATVTAGTNMTFVDEPSDGERSICVVRWQDGVAKLFVVTTEELS